MKLKLLAVGDNLIHKQLYEAAKTAEGSYNFDIMFEQIKPRIKEADIAVINQETILVDDADKVSSFPNFGSPIETGEAIINAGFNVVTHASNHALDKKLYGIHSSLRFWREHRDCVTMLGLNASREEQSEIPVLFKGGIRIALLNYTEKLNFKRPPASEPYCVNLMKNHKKRQIREQIQRAARENDFVIVFPHWGCEYLYEPVKSQKKWAHFFAEAGADLIIGTHPHVVQPAMHIKTGDGRDVLCMYSLGNFISCQVKSGTMLGAMACVTIEKDETGTHIIEKQLIPLVTHTDESYSYFTTYPLASYNDELAAKNKIFRQVKKNYDITVNCEYLRTLFNNIITLNAGENSEFKRPIDVTLSNIKGVFNAVRGKNTKG